MRALLLLLLLVALPAATIDLRFALIRDSELAGKLLAPIAHDQGVSMAALQAWTQRVRVCWAKRRAPPFTRIDGYPADELARRLMLEGDAVTCPWAEAWSLPRLPGYGCAWLEERSVVIAPLAGLAQAEAPGWPAPGRGLARFTAGPKDMKLGGLGDHLVELDLRWRADGLLVVDLCGADAAGAADIRAWLLNRQPLLTLAAAVGVDDAVFLARLLDGADRRLVADRYRVTRRIGERLRGDILAFLATQIERQIERHRR